MLATRPLSRKPDTSRAVLYAMNRWEGLTRYCDDERLQIDNLPVERALRGVHSGISSEDLPRLDTHGADNATPACSLRLYERDYVGPGRIKRCTVGGVQVLAHGFRLACLSN